MAESELITVPARRGKAVRLNKGQSIRVINTHGEQVVDTWAFVADDLYEFMSMEHWRPTVQRIIPEVGDGLVTNKRRPILTLTEDPSSGIHDTLMAACDSYRYGLLGCTEYHDNCTDNLIAAMRQIGLTPPEVPCPLNLFMNIPVLDGRRLEFSAPENKPGDYVTLRAEMDCIMAFSTCPQDILPINGKACIVTEVHFEITGP